MTPIIDKLISENMVTRYTDSKDRRVIRVELTEKGSIFIKDQEKLVKTLLTEKYLTFLLKIYNILATI